MSLYEQWVKTAYNSQGQSNPKIWKQYLPKEQSIYEYILENKVELFSFTVKELAEKYDVPPCFICGFVSGISESLDNEVDEETCEEDSAYELQINFEKLYKKMIEYKAEPLYNLPQWEGIFDAETRDRFMYEMTKAKIYIRDSEKIGRNDLCPCNSGKKYKVCCGK